MPGAADSNFTHNDPEYTARLEQRKTWWKQAIGVDRRYAARIRSVAPKPILEVGCGTGRLLAHFGPDAVGVDSNPHSVQIAQSAGLAAKVSDQYTPPPGGFQSLVFAHVLEHMTLDEAINLVDCYLPALAPDGTVVIVVPQEAGFASDPTHVAFVDVEQVRILAERLDLAMGNPSSFPLPRRIGRHFRYNETMIALRRGSDTA